MKRIVIFTSEKFIKEHNQEELPILEEVFGKENILEFVSDVPKNSIVVPRYRAIPFGDLLDKEIHKLGATLINSYRQHRNIADSTVWGGLLQSLTAPQFFLEDLPNLTEGEWFVKGETNSLKNDWLNSAYAPNKRKLIEVVNSFQKDSYVGNQRVIIKPFKKFRQVATSVTGQPIFNERRVFTLDGKILAEGFYWSNFIEDLGEEPQILNKEKYQETIGKVLKRLEEFDARFVVIDLAEFPNGSWEVVELNDGSMSGLSCVNGFEMWSNFKKEIDLSEIS